MKISYEEAKPNLAKISMYKKYSKSVKYEGYFTDQRIHQNTLPDGLFMYHIRHADNDFSKPCTIEPFVGANFFGTFISDKEIIF